MKAFVTLTILSLVCGCTTGGRHTQGLENGGQVLTSATVEVLGEVHQPGTYPYVAGMTIVDAVNAAGALNDFASGLRVMRGGATIVDHYCGGGAQRTAKLKLMKMPTKSGDMIYLMRTQF